MNETLKSYSPAVGGSGLDLSFATLRRLGRLLRGEDPVEPISPLHVGNRVFQEILGVDINVAIQLESHFWKSDNPEGIENIPGMTDRVMEDFKRYFGHAPLHEPSQAKGIIPGN